MNNSRRILQKAKFPNNKASMIKSYWLYYLRDSTFSVELNSRHV